MSTWLYQFSPQTWSPERYRLEIWEAEKWAWSVGQRAGGKEPQAGDTVVFFCSPTGGKDPGFYGWAVVLEWFPTNDTPLYFRPVAPSDHLKMDPWWDDEAEDLANVIRGKVKRKTMWLVHDEYVSQIRRGIARWLSLSSTATQ